MTNKIDYFEGWHEQSLIWETARPYLYSRTYQNRIVIGGLDEALKIQKIGDTKLLHKRDLLINIVKEMFPQYKNIRAEYYWAAAFGGSHDGLPILKEDKKYIIYITHCRMGKWNCIRNGICETISAVIYK